ncbi:HAAS signaling domain-containing protein [Rhizomonospora bruguierae]|uniref:HAAS signaling domain-containing protein n=1 Tax=Rhizomonospora bruguierae TaxID=1581705 RepID=UPI001BD140E9|nr:hypothetical protein [Micromonospora sp. NBRC 107566]
MSAIVSSEAEGYLGRVRAALADLPPVAREELLEDLAQHLAEVSAEGEGSLADRLGSPEAYAAELRAVAGIAAGGRRVAWEATEVVRRGRAGLRAADLRLGRLLGCGRASDFGRLLHPGWWVLRGYVLAAILLNAFAAQSTGLLPPNSESFWVWLAVVVACVVVSVRFGVVSTGWRRPEARLVVAGANAGLAVLLVFGMFTFADRTMFTEPTHAYEDPYGNTAVFPYDEQGRPLTGVRLLDQNGVELRIGGAQECVYASPRYAEDGWPGSGPLAHPLCDRPHPLPTLAPLPGVSASPPPATTEPTGGSPTATLTVAPTR